MKLQSLLVLSAVALSGCANLAPEREARSACADLTVQVYFEPGSAEVSPEGRGVLNSAAKIAKSCRVTAIDMVAPADAAGDPEVDLPLSKRRVEAVSGVLAAAGLPTSQFPVQAPTPIRRRADVVLHMTRR